MRREKKILALMLLIVIAFTSVMPGTVLTVYGQESNSGENDESGNSESNGISANGTNSFGKMLAEVLNEKMTDQTDYYVSDLEVTGDTVAISCQVYSDCKALAIVYDENESQMAAYGMADICRDEGMADIIITNGNIPEYFVVKVYIMDSKTNAPLSKEFVSNKYTKSFQEFIAKETGDFDENLVLNLDEDENTNFAVFKEEAIITSEEEDINHITDNGNGTYDIENASEEIRNAKNGEIISIYGLDNE